MRRRQTQLDQVSDQPSAHRRERPLLGTTARRPGSGVGGGWFARVGTLGALAGALTLTAAAVACNGATTPAVGEDTAPDTTIAEDVPSADTEPGEDVPQNGPTDTGEVPLPTGPLQIATVASGLANPWGLAFLPDGAMLVTERAGRMRVVSQEGTLSEPLAGLPSDLVTGGQGGLLDVILGPTFEADRLIYFCYSQSGTGGRSSAVARAALDRDAGALEDVLVIFSQQPKTSGNGHFGCRLVFDPAGEHLFIGLGDRQLQGSLPQEPGNEVGKVVRILPDGGVPTDNPFAGTAGAERVWSIGHRNIQGAALHPQTGELWVHEHGPQGGDEVNLVERGLNYGWPTVSYGCPYGQSPCQYIGGGTHAPDYVEPWTFWPAPSTAPSGMAIYDGALIPEWQGHMLVGALAGRTMWALDMNASAPVVCLPAAQRQGCEEVQLVKDVQDRIRDVRVGPDGWVYLLTDESNGRILRIFRE